MAFFAVFSPKNECSCRFTAKVFFLPLVIIFSTAGRKLLALALVVLIFLFITKDSTKETNKASLVALSRESFLPKTLFLID